MEKKDTEHTLKIKSGRLTNRLDTVYERKRGLGMTLKLFS